MTSAYIPVALGAFGLIVAFFVYQWIKKSPVGNGPEKDIADEIHLGAMVFMASEYKRLAVFCVICIVALYASLGMGTAIAFTLGAYVLAPLVILGCTQPRKLTCEQR